jgi:hypothetical protein
MSPIPKEAPIPKFLKVTEAFEKNWHLMGKLSTDDD